MRKYEKIAKELVLRIRSGIYPAGKSLPTHQELCTEFNTSRSNLHKSLNLLEKQQIIERCQGRPCTVLDENERKMLFVFFSSIPHYEIEGHGLGERYLKGIRRFAEEFDYTLQAESGEDFLKQEHSYSEHFSGIILSGSFSPEIPRKLLRRKIPVVALTLRHTDIDLDYISSDFYFAGICAAKEAIRKRFRHLLFVQLEFETEPVTVRSFKLTEHGFFDTLPSFVEAEKHPINYNDLQTGGATVKALLKRLKSGCYDAAVYAVNIPYAKLQEKPEIANLPSIVVDSQLPVTPQGNLIRIEFNHEYNGYLAAKRLHQRIYGGDSMKAIYQTGPVRVLHS